MYLPVLTKLPIFLHPVLLFQQDKSYRNRRILLYKELDQFAICIVYKLYFSNSIVHKLICDLLFRDI